MKTELNLQDADDFYEQLLNAHEGLNAEQSEQLNGNGPILVDIDFRHDYDVDERQYTKEHVEDLIDGYLEIAKGQCQKWTKAMILLG